MVLSKRRVILMGILAAVIAFSAQQLRAQDSLQVISTEPEDGAILKTGEVVKVKMHYKLTSHDAANVSLWVQHEGADGYRNSTVHPVAIKKGEGEIECLISFPMSAAIDDSVAYMNISFGNDLVEQNHALNFRWVDTRFQDVKPDPVFDTVREISVNKQFPQAQKLYDLVMSNGAVDVAWFWFDISPQKWEMSIGTGVCVDAAQKILAACLKCTPDIYNVRIDAIGFSGEVEIGASTDSRNRPMPTNLLHRLVELSTTGQEFRKLVDEWNNSNTRREEDHENKQALNRDLSSKDMQDMFDAFLIETTVPKGIPTNGLIACYKFDGNALDSTGQGEVTELRNTKFAQHGMYLNGLLTLKGYSVIIPVASLRYEQFTISLNFKPIDFLESTDGPGGHMSYSSIITGGQLTRWFAIRRSHEGNLDITFNNTTGVQT